MIDSFTGQYDWLSNFYPCQIKVAGVVYPSVEHAYQAAKTINPEDRAAIAALPNAAQAKRAGKKLVVRDDWEEIKLNVMKQLVRQKFGYGWFALLLIGTGEEELVEGNWWGDTFWGVCRGAGHNHLGRILMDIREEVELARRKS